VIPVRGNLRTWAVWAVLALLGFAAGSVLVFTLSFFFYVVPHGGIW